MTPRSERSVFVFVTVVLFAGCLAAMAHYVSHGRLNHDEGWYLYAARLVYEGRIPYRDFAFFQGPVLPYVYGLVQVLFASGVEAGRLTSFGLAVVTVALAARLAFLRGGRVGTLIVLATVLLTPEALWAMTTTRTEPLSAFWWTVTAFFLMRPNSSVRDASIACAVAVLAAGTRVASLPAAFFVFVLAATRYRSSARQLVAALLPGLVVAAAAVLPILMAGKDVAWFHLISAHSQRHDVFSDAARWSAGDHIEAWLRGIGKIHAAYGFALLGGMAGFFSCVAIRFFRRDGSDESAFVRWATALGALAFLVYLPNLAPRVSFAVYFASAFPLFLVLIGCCVGHAYDRTSASLRPVVVGCVVAMLLVQAAAGTQRYPMLLSRERPDLTGLDEAASYLRENVPKDATLITMDSYLAVESGLALAPGWEMDLFSYFPRLEDRQAQRHHVLSQAAVERSLADPGVGAVALSDRSLGVLVRKKMSAYAYYRRLSDVELHRALPSLERFRLAKVFPEFGQFRDRLYVLLPNASPVMK